MFIQLTRPNPAAQSEVVVKTGLPKTNNVPLLLSSVLKKEPETIFWKRLNTLKSIKNTHMCNKPKFIQLTRPNPAAQWGVVVKSDLPKTNNIPLLLSSVLKKQPETLF